MKWNFMGLRKRVLVGVVGCAALVPTAAMAREHDYRYDRGDRYERRDASRRDYDRRDRDRRRDDVKVDVRIGIGDRVGPVYKERTERVWVEPVYRTVVDRVWVEPVYRTEIERVWIEPVYETREVVRYIRGRRVIERERVMVYPGRWEERPRQVLVSDGCWRTVERRELVSPGYWEYRTTHVRLPDRPAFEIGFGYRGR